MVVRELHVPFARVYICAHCPRRSNHSQLAVPSPSFLHRWHVGCGDAMTHLTGGTGDNSLKPATGTIKSLSLRNKPMARAPCNGNGNGNGTASRRSYTSVNPGADNSSAPTASASPGNTYQHLPSQMKHSRQLRSPPATDKLSSPTNFRRSNCCTTAMHGNHISFVLPCSL